MHNKFAVILLINLITSCFVNSRAQFGHQRVYRLEDKKTNTEFDNMPLDLKRMVAEHPVWKRNSQDKYPDSFNEPGGSDYEYDSSRPDNGSFKILNHGYSSREQSDIVFPGPKSSSSNQVVPVLGKSPCGPGKPFCEYVDNYPTEYIDKILRNSVVDIAEFLPKDDNSIEVGQRFNAPGEESLCTTYTDVYRPQSAENKYGQWLFVINQDKYVQEIRMELCNGTDQPCKFTENFPNGYETRCKQNYVYRKLYALDNNRQRVLQDTFKLPSCCSCVVSYTGNISLRSGLGASSPAANSKKTTSFNRKARRAKRMIKN